VRLDRPVMFPGVMAGMFDSECGVALKSYDSEF